MNDYIPEQNPTQALREMLTERLSCWVAVGLGEMIAEDLVLMFEGVWVHKDVEWPKVDSPETGLPESAIFTRTLQMEVKLPSQVAKIIQVDTRE